MFPITDETRSLFLQNYRQTAEIQVHTADETFVLTDKDIALGGFTFDRASVTGSKIELGAAVASELSLELNNSDGRFDGIRFEGAELFAHIAVRENDDAPMHPVTVGYFTVDAPARALATVSLSAFDRMVLFDKEVDWTLFMFPLTVKKLLEDTCKICNVPLKTDIGGKPNFNYPIQHAPSADTTYRQIIQWIAELTATCAFINWEGSLCLQWYVPTGETITPAERYSSDMLENDIVISGVEIVDSDGNVYLSGDDAYAFKIEGNALVQGDYQSVCEAVYQDVGGFTYRPYECTAKSMPYLFPLDMLTYVDKNGVSHETIVTNITFTLNGGTEVQGQGETETQNGYASANPLTKRESVIINSIKQSLNETMNSSLQSVIEFNKTIANSLGVHTSTETMPDGSVKYYMHDKPTLAESKTIYTYTADGFAVTNSGWNNGKPNWIGGFTKDSNLIVKKINAYGIEVSDPNTKYVSHITPGAFSVWYGAMQILTINGDESIFTKVKSNQIECGRIRLLPHIKDGVLLGSNLVFLDNVEE